MAVVSDGTHARASGSWSRRWPGSPATPGPPACGPRGGRRRRGRAAAGTAGGFADGTSMSSVSTGRGRRRERGQRARPPLVAVAHGSRDPAAQRTVEELLDLVREGRRAASTSCRGLRRERRAVVAGRTRRRGPRRCRRPAAAVPRVPRGRRHRPGGRGRGRGGRAAARARPALCEASPTGWPRRAHRRRRRSCWRPPARPTPTRRPTSAARPSCSPHTGRPGRRRVRDGGRADHRRGVGRAGGRQRRLRRRRRLPAGARPVRGRAPRRPAPWVATRWARTPPSHAWSSSATGGRRPTLASP